MSRRRARLRSPDAAQPPLPAAEAPLPRGPPRSRHGCVPARRGEARRGPDRDPAPERRREPETVVAHLGPTNSGKTHDALAFLAEHGRGVYAGPLRMLAQEAHRRLGGRARCGPGRARHGRGADQRARADPLLHRRDGAGPGRGARPRRGAVGGRRGARRRLDASSCSPASTEHIRLLGALDALPLVRRAFPDAELRVHERKLPLEFVGARQLRALTPGTGRRRVQPQGGARARRRGQPAPARTGSRCSTARCRSPRGARRSTASSPAARTSASRPTSSATASTFPARRCSSPRRRSSTARRGATCCRGSSRRSPVAPAASGSSSAVTSACSSASAVGERRPGARRVGARAARRAPRGPPRLSHRRRGAHRAAARRSRRRRPARPRRRARRVASRRDAPVGARELARGRVARSRSAAGSPSSSGTCASAAAASALEDTWSSSTRRSTRTARSSSACSRSPSPGDTRAARRCCSSCSTPSRLRDASLEEAEEAGRVAAILRWFALQYPGVGGVTIERAAALEQAAAAAGRRAPRGRGARRHARPLPLVRPDLPAVVSRSATAAPAAGVRVSLTRARHLI